MDTLTGCIGGQTTKFLANAIHVFVFECTCKRVRKPAVATNRVVPS